MEKITEPKVNEETASLDASFMEGYNLNAGAIAGSKYIKNPIGFLYILYPYY